MELRQLVYFEAVARLGGFSRAAAELRIAQPAISMQVKRLESELGVRLFDRTTRQVTVTHAGELFLPHARTVLEQLKSGKAELDQLSAVLRGRLTIGATAVLGSFDLPQTLARFHRSYPNVELVLRTGLIAGLLDQIDRSEIDVVLGPRHPDLPDRYQSETLANERLVLVMPPQHRSFPDPALTLRAVSNEAFICLPEGSGLRAMLVAAAAAAGFAPRIPFETHSPGSIREMVAAGLGVALLAESVALVPGPPVMVSTMRLAATHPPIGMIRSGRRQPSATAAAWWNLVVS